MEGLWDQEEVDEPARLIAFVLYLVDFVNYLRFWYILTKVCKEVGPLSLKNGIGAWTCVGSVVYWVSSH